jgi:uncharacterized membrane protein YphA (DoxX/SURF4 family)
VDEGFEAAALGFRFILAFVFLNASLSKLFAPAHFALAVRNYRLLPASLNEPVARWLPRLELALALALLLGVAAGIAAGVAALMLVLFAGAVSINLARGREIDCGCLATPSPRTIRWSLVVTDLGLAAMAGVLAVVDPHVLAVLPFGSGAPSSLETGSAIALALLATLLVIGYLIVSGWLSLRSAIRTMSEPRKATP